MEPTLWIENHQFARRQLYRIIHLNKLFHIDIPRFFYIISCRTPVWLKTAFAVLVQEGGVLVHGWCAEKENRGKGGSGKGKIGAGVGSCRSMDLVGISSGSVGTQSGTNFSVSPDWIPTGQKRCPKMLKLVPDWVPTGSRLDPDWFSSKKHRFP